MTDQDQRPAGSATLDACAGSCAIPVPARMDALAPAVRTVLWLSGASLAWMTAEGALGLYAGVRANSLSLVGWALGSVIEGLASVIVIWRFTGRRRLSEHAERRAQQGVAVSFWLLAPYLAVQAFRDLLGAHQVSTTALGVAVTGSSLLVMPGLGLAKRRLAVRVGSAATAGEGTQNLLCAAQALAVLLGLGVHGVTGANWVDPAVALLLGGWAVREGRVAWRGGDCC